VPVREPENEETQEQVEAEQKEEQERINNGMSGCNNVVIERPF
jgi:SWI/SNF-related matrix-associated actin-dependent regulator of chromatin subfamily A member 5